MNAVETDQHAETRTLLDPQQIDRSGNAVRLNVPGVYVGEEGFALEFRVWRHNEKR